MGILQRLTASWYIRRSFSHPPASITPYYSLPVMKTKRSIGLLAAVCAMLALSSITSASPDNTDLEKALSGLGYTAVPLRKTALNSFEVNATLNGNKPITMLVSFQAVNTLFNTKKLDEMGIKYEKAGQEFVVNDDKDDLYIIRTDSINIGTGKLASEEIMCIDYSEFSAFDDYRVTGILGRDFLIKYNAIIDFADQKLYLKTK